MHTVVPAGGGLLHTVTHMILHSYTHTEGSHSHCAVRPTNTSEHAHLHRGHRDGTHIHLPSESAMGTRSATDTHTLYIEGSYLQPLMQSQANIHRSQETVGEMTVIHSLPHTESHTPAVTERAMCSDIQHHTHHTEKWQ